MDGMWSVRSVRDLQIDSIATRIETLLEEAYNERMHLLTFMKMSEPGWFMKVSACRSLQPVIMHLL